MRQIHGVADAKKIQAVNEDNCHITVRDGTRLVILDIGHQTYPGGLSPDRARFVAAQLIASAKRVETAMQKEGAAK